MLLSALVFVLFPAAMAYAASSDLVSMTISNRLQAILVVGFFAAAVAAGLPMDRIGLHLAAFAMVLVVGFGCFAMGWMGGGDAKLAAAIALWFGLDFTLLQFLLIGSVLGAFLTVGLMWLRDQPLPALAASQNWIVRLHHPKTGIPYGIALAAGALCVFPSSFWMNAAVGLS
jgi:prepilin peptidase CpaA